MFIPVSSSLFTGLQGSDIRCLGFAKKPGHCVYLHGSDAFSDLTSFEWRGLGEGGRIYFTIGSGCQVPRKTRWENVNIWVFPENNGTPKSSILIGFSIINHLFWGTCIFGNTHINMLNQTWGESIKV